MTTLSMSSYSVREHLGPVEFTFTDPQGETRTFSFPYQSLTTLAEFPARAKAEFGVDAIETVAFQFKGGLDDPELDAFAEGLRASGVTLLNVAIDAGDLLEIDDDKRAADVAELKRWIERFASMGARFVRVNPGTPFSAHHGPQAPAHLVSALVELGDFARAHGTRLLVENHGGPSSDPAWMLGLLDAVGSDHLGLLLDLGNFDALMQPAMALIFQGPDAAPVDPVTLLENVDLAPVYAGIEQLAPRAELVHVKAHDVDEAGTVRAVDLDRAIRILRDHGYDGPYTVEYEGTGGDPWAKSARVLEVTREAAEVRA
ncbi:sugar phosphate isomerase/epimerase [Cnuibacter physcomitrellae]|uniref:sugar phosphate isomerase/epimerase family protein n=1 Tax=Cnuibacter physcomitrellae TaxID=1619308 RepID=UPI002175F88D|nr:sugar phosphate isomerase/epimerase family protein [Cnuibacter physcomitrellae]MCS5497988.1 sugar phosphate isomerase/epimerase [Cnuibacter physcomitrellae]